MLAAEGEVSIEAALLCESSPKNLFYSYCIEDRSDEVVVDLKAGQRLKPIATLTIT